MEKIELDEGFQPHHPPFRRLELRDLVGALLDALLGVEARVVAPGLERFLINS